MAERGDVLQVKRRLGFGADRAGERVVVIQADPLNEALPTTLVVPLDSDPNAVPESLAVRVSAAEAGTDEDCVAIPTQLQVALHGRLAAGRVGRLRPGTLALLDDKLRLVLDL
ncbi:MAG: type II toxin-antitoxin system PemK/MazF family toxin [Polyangiaceae bacterium]|nr:type II toxin-antitoxin system PemK/MazF family toxin [Polyangiaceae bacterium]